MSVRLPKKVEIAKIGAEIKEWSDIESDMMDASIRQCLNHYNYFYDHKDTYQWTLTWAEKNCDAETLDRLKKLRYVNVSFTLGGMCRIHDNGAPLESRHLEWMHRKIDEALACSPSPEENEDTPSSPRKSPSEALAERAHDLIAELEAMLDCAYDPETISDVESFRLSDRLKAEDVPKIVASSTYNYFEKPRDELAELIDSDDPDLEYAYRNVGKRHRRKILKFLNTLLSDLNQWMQEKAAARKPRKRKVKSAAEQTEGVKFLQSSKEFGLTSKKPEEIVKAKSALIFNVRYRTITHLVAEDKNGLWVKGTTIQGFDPKRSIKKTLRKPEEFWSPTIPKSTKDATTSLSTIKTKDAKATGRLSEDTIILEVYR